MKIPTATGSVLDRVPERVTGNVLLVDDDAAVLEVTKKILEHMGYQVTATRSGSEALNLFETDPALFDLVITDMIMPQMKGDDLARAIMAIRPGMPVIISTGFSDNSLEKATAIGIRGFILKPFLMQELQRLILHVLEEGPCAVCGRVDGHNAVACASPCDTPRAV